jgi:hypothetical protein
MPVIRAARRVRTVITMTITDRHQRLRAHPGASPKTGATRIDAILALIDRGLDEATVDGTARGGALDAASSAPWPVKDVA